MSPATRITVEQRSYVWLTTGPRPDFTTEGQLSVLLRAAAQRGAVIAPAPSANVAPQVARRS